MEKPIGVGDLVVIIKWPCCDKYTGLVRTVVSIRNNPLRSGLATCGVCGATVLVTSVAELTPTVDGWQTMTAAVAWLRRIPPMEELQSDRLREEQPA